MLRVLLVAVFICLALAAGKKERDLTGNPSAKQCDLEGFWTAADTHLKVGNPGNPNFQDITANATFCKTGAPSSSGYGSGHIDYTATDGTCTINVIVPIRWDYGFPSSIALNSFGAGAPTCVKSGTCPADVCTKQISISSSTALFNTYFGETNPFASVEVKPGTESNNCGKFDLILDGESSDKLTFTRSTKAPNCATTTTTTTTKPACNQTCLNAATAATFACAAPSTGGNGGMYKASFTDSYSVANKQFTIDYMLSFDLEASTSTPYFHCPGHGGTGTFAESVTEPGGGCVVTNTYDTTYDAGCGFVTITTAAATCSFTGTCPADTCKKTVTGTPTVHASTLTDKTIPFPLDKTLNWNSDCSGFTVDGLSFGAGGTTKTTTTKTSCLNTNPVPFACTAPSAGSGMYTLSPGYVEHFNKSGKAIDIAIMIGFSSSTSVLSSGGPGSLSVTVTKGTCTITEDIGLTYDGKCGTITPASATCTFTGTCPKDTCKTSITTDTYKASTVTDPLPLNFAKTLVWTGCTSFTWNGLVFDSGSGATIGTTGTTGTTANPTGTTSNPTGTTAHPTTTSNPTTTGGSAAGVKSVFVGLIALLVLVLM